MSNLYACLSRRMNAGCNQLLMAISLTQLIQIHSEERSSGGIGAILLVLRCTGSRRSEVVQLRLDDLDRAKSLMYVATKKHKDRLPVLMYPWVRDLIWQYVTTFRPVIPSASAQDQRAIFLSHSVRNYGEKKAMKGFVR